MLFDMNLELYVFLLQSYKKLCIKQWFFGFILILSIFSIRYVS